MVLPAYLEHVKANPQLQSFAKATELWVNVCGQKVTVVKLLVSNDKTCYIYGPTCTASQV